MKFLGDLKSKNLSNKTILLRVDFNIEEGESIEKSLRFLNAVKTAKILLSQSARVVFLSYRGRPTRKDPKLSLKPFLKPLSKNLKLPIRFLDFYEKNLRAEVSKSVPGSVFLMENLRFDKGEDKNDKRLAKKLADIGNIYINDAFSQSHRKNASVEAITKLLPSYAGPTLEKEIKNLSAVLKNPKKPLIVILGGAKISDKLGLIENFINKADYFLIGGAMANNFLLAQGLPIGDSLYEKELLGFAKNIDGNKQIVLPTDFAIQNRKILDIGEKSRANFAKIIKSAKTIIWNGPMGQYENPKFAKGTYAIIEAILKNKKAAVIIGGGETAQSIAKFSKNIPKNKNIFVSTGGGAMLQYLSGKKLPGIEALK